MGSDPAVRLGLIGAGRWGRTCLRVLGALDGVRVTAVASGNPETAGLVPPGCRISADWHDLLTDIDGLIVASPPATHAAIAHAAMAKNLPLFIEKPLTLSPAEARDLVRAAETTTARVVMVDHIHLFSPAFRRLKALAADCGPILAVDGVAGNHGPYRQDASVLWDWGPHDVAMCLDLMGRAPDAVAVTRLDRRAVDGGVGETVRLDLDFGGLPARATVGTLMDKTRRLTVRCARATLVYDDLAPAKLTRDGVAEPIDPTPPLTAAFQAFAAAIRGNGRTVDGLTLGAAVVDILDRAQRALDADGAP